jgi:peptidylprolyl isomerase
MLTKRLSTLALFTAATLGLSACGSGDDPSPDVSPNPSTSAAADAATLAAVEWSEAADGTPLLTFDFPLSVSGSSARLVQDGDGATIEAGQVVIYDYIVFSGVDGTVNNSTYGTGTPGSQILSEDSVVPSLWDVLVGNHVGAHIIFATLDGSAPLPDGTYSSLVVAMTVVNATERAEGEAVAPVAGLPTVTLAENGAPSIDFTGTVMPTSLVVQPLIVGSGAPVVSGQTLIVHYTGWLWDGAKFDSSWDSGTPMSFALGEVIDGWNQGLAGQLVGSQVLLVIPPELGYGDVDNGPIPAGSTLVFVVDILAAS